MPRSVFRWAGGKTWLAPFLSKLFLLADERYNYVEPFMGGGGVFFSLTPARAYLNDVNSRLINVFRLIKRDPDRIFDIISKLPVNRESYYAIRAANFTDEWLSAVQFIYLNRLCFGGLHRVNSKGEFNVPYGNKNSLGPAASLHNLRQISKSLKNAKLRSGDFSKVLHNLNAPSFIFADPVYTSTARERFDRYNEGRFSIRDHERLAEQLQQLAIEKGSIAIVTLPFDKTFLSIYGQGHWILFTRDGRHGFAKERSRTNCELVWVKTGDEKFIDGLSELLRTKNSSFNTNSFKILGFSRNQPDFRVFNRWERRLL